ncbi:MAG TPA: hypothetical protein VGM80_12845 [Gaiellaceae bacterium]
MRRVGSLLLAVVAAGAVTLGGAAAKGSQHFFFGPGTSTSCEMDVGMPKIGTDVYCQTYPHAESVTLSAKGTITLCHGIKCIGNPPDQVPTLVYGNWLAYGPFRCTSLRAGVKCVITRTGRGFLISPTSIKRL